MYVSEVSECLFRVYMCVLGWWNTATQTSRDRSVESQANADARKTLSAVGNLCSRNEMAVRTQDKQKTSYVSAECDKKHMPAQ